MKIKTLKDLVQNVNHDLGDFTQWFANTRKELAQLGRSPKKDILFKYENEDRDWAISEGGGTEIQYHIYLRDDEIGFGLGFNFQYVPFANDKSPIDFMKPYSDAFLELLMEKQINTKEFYWLIGEEEQLKDPQYGQYYLYGRTIEITNDSIEDSEYQKMLGDIKTSLFEIYKEVFKLKNEKQKLINEKIENMESYKTLLLNNRNLILTGAPGTGKTYLAKEIAKAMGCSENEIDFVQFHPSYDYTDFVEGLRPKGDDGNIGFERKDGVFKAFCEKAKKNLLDAKKTEKQLQIELSWDEKVITFLNDSIEKQSEYPLTNGGNVMIENYHEDIVDIILPHNAIHKSDKIHISKLLKILNAEQTFDKAIEVERYLRDYHSAEYSYLLAIYQAIKKYSFNTSNLIPEKTEKKNFVFIIDEINRGEISKIFGELFFSIDPGYRGTNGIVKSQYQNLVPMNSAFAEGFYVPENVYIIGTMNDIDRSVESMDFAFRRRFAFKEIKSKDRVEMLYDTENGIGEYAEKAQNRMIHLNEEIEKIEGLSSAYHIGPAYFLKLKNYDGNFSKLWEYHLEGLLREYLRGMQDVEGKIKVLKEAYENENDPDDGQQQ